MDKEKFDDAIWDLFMMETMHRTNGDPIQADRVKNIRVKLKEAAEQSVHPTLPCACWKDECNVVHIDPACRRHPQIRANR